MQKRETQCLGGTEEINFPFSGKWNLATDYLDYFFSAMPPNGNIAYF
ncbi:MAG: hypothetical protein Q8891_12955 [Bacteroidota bacterium]|nr:hypothetical protein [Bacteroidota bacterium]